MVELVETPIPGLLVVKLDVHGDARGWFKENWQREKLVALGLPDFGPVQNNMSLNAKRGATRGIHTEPWDKFVSVATGRVFAAWVDMRAGESFGTAFHLEIGPDIAVFIPRGVGNSYQALEDGTVYSYLVNDHWQPGPAYPALNLADETAGIPWPIPLDSPEAEISEKDLANPRLHEVTPMLPKKTLVIGNGQLGKAFKHWVVEQAAEQPSVETTWTFFTRADSLDDVAWSEYDTIINTAAWTKVDQAELEPASAWADNAELPACLARIATEHRLTLVHYSTDYVAEPRGVYAASKLAGDIAVATTPKHYILRTSWVIGDGYNFVHTMAGLAAKGVSPSVVDDQIGRLTFTDTLVAATRHLLGSSAAYGTYEVSNSGEPLSWFQIAREVFSLTGHDPAQVSPTSTKAYAEGVLAQGKPFAPRPLNSVLDLAKLQDAGFAPVDQLEALRAYVSTLKP